MKRSQFMLLGALGALALASATAARQRDAEGFVRVTPEQVQWVTDTDGSGVQRATIEGDPSKPGTYVIRVKFPRGMMSRPHFHHEDRHVVVLQGTWWSGTGEEFAPDKTIAMKPGSYMKHPAGAKHFDGAKNEEVIVQITGVGPSDTVRLHPELGNYASSLPR